MLGLTELAVASHADASKAGLCADVDRLVEMTGCILGTVNIAGTIDDRQNFLCVCKVNESRSSAVNRRQKSPAVVGSGIESAPMTEVESNPRMNRRSLARSSFLRTRRLRLATFFATFLFT